jgi:hypothetical protein
MSQIVIDRDSPMSGTILRVPNGRSALVTLVNKSPFEKCTADKKREEIPDPSAIPSLLSLISGAAGSLSLIPVPAPPRGAPPSPSKSLDDQLVFALQSTSFEAIRVRGEFDKLQTAYKTEADALATFFQTPYRNGNGPGGAAFATDHGTRTTSLAAVLTSTVPSLAGAEALYAGALKLLQKYQETPGWDPETLRLHAELLAMSRSHIDAEKDVQAKLSAARERLSAVAEYLKQIATPDWRQRFTIAADRNAKITGAVSCVDSQSQKATLDPVAFTIIFQDPPRFSLGAGVLISSLEKNSIGPASTVTTRPTDLPTTAVLKLVSSPTRPQVMPFSLVHIRLGGVKKWQNRDLSFNLSPGIGVNPNNSGNEAEFFTGVSLGIGGFYLSGGAHIGHGLEPGGGFRIGDTLPNDIKTVPLVKPWKPGFGFAVTYRIPIK